jgi:hypothetical protein
MNYKIFGASVAAAVLAVALIASPMYQAMAQPGYTTVTDESVTANPSGKVYKFSVTTDGAIPKTADEYIDSVIVFGYAWLGTSTTGAVDVVVATIHPGIDDSNQNPNNWHPHTATLVGSGDCGAGTLGLAVTNLQSPQGGIAITGNTLTMTLPASSATVSPSTYLDAATGFQLVLGDSGALCVAEP